MKIIVPQEPFLDSQLDLLLQRGKKNGARVEMMKRLKKCVLARTSVEEPYESNMCGKTKNSFKTIRKKIEGESSLG